MCGAIGLIYEKQRDDLGLIAAELLRTLEYRGYDSTGAAIQGAGEDFVLRKGVGAPSVMVHELGIVNLPGQIMCGQVRWATFGAVTEANSQPHAVRCKATLYGAHNGNVTNCDQLKIWLTGEGHEVRSDNDGEMVVHTVEHFFALALDGKTAAQKSDPAFRRAAMRAALVNAAPRLEGSYAAVIVDPQSRTLWGVKQGSSFYFGTGADDVGGRFAIASSDLSSVLKLTRVVVPLREGEFVEFDAAGHCLYAVRDQLVPPVNAQAHGSGDAEAQGGKPELQTIKAGGVIERTPVRSRLRAKDTGLSAPFQTFMDQEISSQEETCRSVVRLFHGGAEATLPYRSVVAAHGIGDVRRIAARLDALRDRYDDAEIRAAFHALVDAPEFQALSVRVPAELLDRAGRKTEPTERRGAEARIAETLYSTEAGFFTDLLLMARGPADLVAVQLLDALLEREEVAEFGAAVEQFLAWATDSLARGGRLLIVCCGSSYNAARAAALFFNEMAHTDLVPLLPGEFRERVSHSLRDGDLIIAVSQSGETKDLIDVMNDTIRSGRAIRRVALVNNVNSTLAEEKCELCIPLRCGPEVAVPATKSFMNQIAVLYGLALRFGERRVAGLAPQGADAGVERVVWAADLSARSRRFSSVDVLLRETVVGTERTLDDAAELLYLSSSVHLLAIRLTALAREGALKIREVVLNHAEGFEGSEFKHGPNTILGWNTIFGPREVEALLKKLDEQGALRERHELSAALFNTLQADYPLIYLTGPDERDVNLTISQINTHKIRGSCTIVIAEEHAGLRAAAEKPPSDNANYRSVYIALPRTDDILMTVFSATVALQRLALKMSLRKLAYLDRLGIKDHGVHPDVPKNVSKSITVD